MAFTPNETNRGLMPPSIHDLLSDISFSCAVFIPKREVQELQPGPAIFNILTLNPGWTMLAIVTDEQEARALAMMREGAVYSVPLDCWWDFASNDWREDVDYERCRYVAEKAAQTGRGA